MLSHFLMIKPLSFMLSGSLFCLTQNSYGKSLVLFFHSPASFSVLCSKCFNKLAHQVWRYGLCSLMYLITKVPLFGMHKSICGIRGLGANLVTMIKIGYFVRGINNTLFDRSTMHDLLTLPFTTLYRFNPLFPFPLKRFLLKLTFIKMFHTMLALIPF